MSRRRHRRRSGRYYQAALEAADRDLVERARDLTGIDEEIALLRASIFRLVEAGNVDPRHLHSAMRLLLQALAARDRLSGEHSERLAEATGRLMEEFFALFTEAGEEVAHD